MLHASPTCTCFLERCELASPSIAAVEVHLAASRTVLVVYGPFGGGCAEGFIPRLLVTVCCVGLVTVVLVGLRWRELDWVGFVRFSMSWGEEKKGWFDLVLPGLSWTGLYFV